MCNRIKSSNYVANLQCASWLMYYQSLLTSNLSGMNKRRPILSKFSDREYVLARFAETSCTSVQCSRTERYPSGSAGITNMALAAPVLVVCKLSLLLHK